MFPFQPIVSSKPIVFTKGINDQQLLKCEVGLPVMSPKKLLVLGNANSPLLSNLYKSIKEHFGDKLLIDIISDQSLNVNPATTSIFRRILQIDTNYPFANIPRIRVLWHVKEFRRCLGTLEHNYDWCHIHYLSVSYYFLLSAIRSTNAKLILSIYGSEYYGATGLIKGLQRRVINAADKITFSNEITQKDFTEFYKVPLEKTTICRFGLSILNNLKADRSIPKSRAKEMCGVDKGALVICCGYNADPDQKHLVILEALKMCRSQLPDACTLFFPLTYGRKATYIKKLAAAVRKSGFRFIFFDKFMPDPQVALLRKAADIMINIQPTDQFSGSMQEHLYAENVVITGSWLPYDTFDTAGASFLKIDRVEELPETLIHAVNELDILVRKAAVNPEVIWELSSWERCLPLWLDLYS